ncbi:carboxypeptidase-like regulatory domain-containing protein [Frateuria sp. GZRe12]|uniref:carboxypeptidase-like regulatory domain-containing protein n=1 Tax=Frateuria sp. GZRe12 TaxID=3351533 RepID=UPI003EDC9449
MNACISTQSGAARRSMIRNLALVAVAGICATAGISTARAAETTGRVFGQAPSGATVLVSSPEYALQRKIPVGTDGRYMASWLPIGVYEVTVIDNGQALVRHPSVQVFVDRGSRVDFSCANGQCPELAAN